MRPAACLLLLAALASCGQRPVCVGFKVPPEQREPQPTNDVQPNEPSHDGNAPPPR
jgi:hypothetical protein